MRIGIFGGRFDPVHLGHLLAAQSAQEKLRLGRVLFMIAARPPHKRCALDYTDRLDLLKRALRGWPGFSVCELESAHPGRSYTILSLARLREILPHDRLYLLIGADEYQQLHSWYQPDRLADYAEIVVLTRPGFAIAEENHRVRCLPVRQVQISSSEIRRRLRRRLSIHGLVPEAVARQIYRKGYYQ